MQPRETRVQSLRVKRVRVQQRELIPEGPESSAEGSEGARVQEPVL